MAKKVGPPTKSEVLATIAAQTGLTRKQVAGVLESLNGITTVPTLCEQNQLLAVVGRFWTRYGERKKLIEFDFLKQAETQDL